QVSGPQAERRAPDPQEERQVSGPQAERRAPDPQVERQVSGPQAERRAPDPQAERQVSGPRRGGGHRVTRHNRGLRVNWDDRWHWVRHGSSGWTAGIGSPGIRSFGSTAGTRHLARQWAPSQLVYDRGALGQTLDRSGWTAGTGSPGIRSFGS
ncbi:unnamed protein product, partial [Staurois parvus]